MPFYELVCIARTKINDNNLKDLVKKSALQVLDRGGVVRGFQKWGERPLPHRIKRHQMYHDKGCYWLMQFDAHATVVQQLSQQMLVDERVLRHTIVKLGSKLNEIVKRD